jgi:hypothetical protein
MVHSARWILKRGEMECSSMRGVRLTRNADDVQWDGLLQEPIAEAMRHGNLQSITTQLRRLLAGKVELQIINPFINIYT